MKCETEHLQLSVRMECVCFCAKLRFDSLPQPLSLYALMEFLRLSGCTKRLIHIAAITAELPANLITLFVFAYACLILT